MKLLLGLIVGVAVGAALVWVLSTNRGQKEAQSAGQQIEAATKSGYEAVQKQIQDWKLTPEDIKKEISASGQVVRKKAEQAGQVVADATADARTTATIKGKYVADRSVPAMAISVNTTAGVVTLSGAVDTADEVSRAMTLAMQVEGVREVISTLQVKGSPPTVTRKSATNGPATSSATK